MKKTLLFASLIFGALIQMSAQCTIVPSCTASSTGGYCTVPTPSSTLVSATVLSPYNTTIQLTIGSTVFISPLTVPISSATLTSLTGLPTGLSYSVNPVGGAMLGGASGCLLITGTPATGTAGNYTITANVSVTTPLGAGPGSASWFLTVNPATTTGIVNQEIATTVFLAPNPATSELAIISDTHLGKIVVSDALGKIVLIQDANYTNQTTLNVQNFTKGIYFVQVYNGTKMITKKFIKD